MQRHVAGMLQRIEPRAWRRASDRAARARPEETRATVRAARAAACAARKCSRAFSAVWRIAALTFTSNVPAMICSGDRSDGAKQILRQIDFVPRGMERQRADESRPSHRRCRLRAPVRRSRLAAEHARRQPHQVAARRVAIGFQRRPVGEQSRPRNRTRAHRSSRRTVRPAAACAANSSASARATS